MVRVYRFQHSGIEGGHSGNRESRAPGCSVPGRPVRTIMVELSEIILEGGVPLRGTVGVMGAKNAVLQQMISTLLCPGWHRLSNVPDIADVRAMMMVLEHLGVRCDLVEKELAMVVPERMSVEAPLELVRSMRASILLLGPLLARFGEAQVPLPGGDDLGARPVDMHLNGLRQMGAELELVHGVLVGKAPRGLSGAEMELSFPSVGATQNLLMAAVMAKGDSAIINAAREPEIEDLGRQLDKMGARLSGVGSSIIRIRGTKELHPVAHRVIPDRIAAGTYAMAAAVTAGEVTITGCEPSHLRMELAKLDAVGCEVERGEGWLRLAGPDRPEAVDFATLPYPGFHTDLHPQMVSVLSVAKGTSVITENLYDGRFRYVGELARMGADIYTEWQHAVVRGVERLSGCPVMATDIRAGAALVIAGLVADGVTLIEGVEHIDRGYADLVGNLAGLGARIRREEMGGDGGQRLFGW